MKTNGFCQAAIDNISKKLKQLDNTNINNNNSTSHNNIPYI